MVENFIFHYLAGLGFDEHGFDEQMSCISELKKFAGKSSMAQQITEAGNDPYKVIFSI